MLDAAWEADVRTTVIAKILDHVVDRRRADLLETGDVRREATTRTRIYCIFEPLFLVFLVILSAAIEHSLGTVASLTHNGALHGSRP